MGHMWPKYGKNMGWTMVHIWYFYGLDMGYCLPYQTHTWSLFLLKWRSIVYSYGIATYFVKFHTFSISLHGNCMGLPRSKTIWSCLVSMGFLRISQSSIELP
jgi:hypothetical protein